MRVFVLWHEEYDYDDCSFEVMGVYETREEAEAKQHGSMRARNKDGSVSFRRGDTRPKVWTLDGCDGVTEFETSTGQPVELDDE